MPALVVALLPAALIATASPAGAADDPSQINFTLEGCRNDGSITLPNGSGAYVCPDAAYTTGNLGKGWNELDLVPHRVTLRNTSGTQTYSFVVAGDYKNGSGTGTGWDVISALTKNSASSTSCPAVTTDTQIITPSGQGVGGADQTIYRLVTIAQPVNTTCVYDYYQRLALGAHNFSGSSLQSNLWNQHLTSSGIGQKRLSLPVGAILPQSIDKNVAASRGSGAVWSVTKSANHASLAFNDTCATGASLSRGVEITVSWNKVVSASGDVTVVTYLYATNPAHRVITVDVADVVSDTGGVLYTIDPAAVNVPAGASNYSLLGYDSSTPPSALSDTRTVASTATSLSDTATATYTDLATGITVPGTTTVSKTTTVSSTGTTANGTATITDSESITGDGLTFSVATPSVGSFTGTPAYVAGTHTTGPVTWSSGAQTTSGSVTFVKTVYVDAPRLTSGTLSDTAHLTSATQSIDSNTVSVAISTNPLVNIAVSKTMNQRFAGSKVFNFELWTGAFPGTDTGLSTSVTIPAGSAGPVSSTAITGLDPSLSYYFEESATAPFAAQTTGATTFTLVPGDLTSCSASVVVSNSAAPATARVRKISDPTGGNWSMTLTGPSSLSETISVVAGAGYSSFTSDLTSDGGIYTITETIPVTTPPWDNTAVSGDFAGTASRVTASTTTHSCSFVLNLTTDSDGVFSCTLTNVERGSIAIHKTVGGAAPSGTDAFTFQLRSGASTASNGTTLDTEVANAGNGGNVSFSVGGSTSLVPGTYQVCEFIMVGWSSTIQTATGAFVPGTGGSTTADNTYVCIPFVLAAGQTATINVDNTRPPGGMAKTIGFWKNWASCASSNGKQRPILDQTLTASGGTIYIGTLNVTTCAVAVDLLDKRAIANPALVGDGKKMASDPAWNVAAQLLAYRLNLVAGAGDKPAAATAAADAQAILVAISFDGNTHTHISAAQAAALNADNGVLDAYNNNTL